MVHFTRAQHVEILVGLLDSPQADVPKLLREIDRLDPESRQSVLAATKIKLLTYFERQADAATDETKGMYDFASALRSLDTADGYYPDSAELMVFRQYTNQRKGLHTIQQLSEQAAARAQSANSH